MAELNKKIFKGIRQASLTTYQNTEDKDGFLWLVKDGDKRFICLGKQSYSTTDPEQTDANVQRKVNETMASIIESDLLHSFTDDGTLRNEVSLSLKTDDDGKDILHLIGKNNTDIATLDMSKFAIDGMVDSVTYDKASHTLTISWNTSAGKTDTIISLTDLVDVYTNGDGVEITNEGVISIKLSNDTQDFLTVDGNGLKLSNIDGSHILIGKTIIDESNVNVIGERETIADSFQLMYNLINQIKKDDAINLEEATDATINNGHIELIKGDNGIYANMYYMTNTD